jgi:hypothetical protein
MRGKINHSLLTARTYINKISVKMMGRYSEEIRASIFKEIKAYVQCNVQGQKVDPRCEFKKHIVVFTYQLYKFTFDVYNDVH